MKPSSSAPSDSWLLPWCLHIPPGAPTGNFNPFLLYDVCAFQPLPPIYMRPSAITWMTPGAPLLCSRLWTRPPCTNGQIILSKTKVLSAQRHWFRASSPSHSKSIRTCPASTHPSSHLRKVFFDSSGGRSASPSTLAQMPVHFFCVSVIHTVYLDLSVPMASLLHLFVHLCSPHRLAPHAV